MKYTRDLRLILRLNYSRPLLKRSRHTSNNNASFVSTILKFCHTYSFDGILISFINHVKKQEPDYQ